MITAALWSALIWTGAANATPGVERSARSTFSMVAESCDERRGAATTSGPLNPGPNPCAKRSYAWRVVSVVGPLLASVKARRIENSGTARATRAMRARIAEVQGCRWIARLQRYQKLSGAGVAPVWSRLGRRIRSMARPAKRDRAG